MSALHTQTDELERIKMVRDLAILDTQAEPEFDEIVKFAADLCQTRYVILTLADTERLWFKSKIGLDICEIQREISICNHTLVNNRILEIKDAREDPVFCDNPLVKSDLSIRFYLGIPLRLKAGVAIGTLCVLDDKPQVLTDTQKTGLQLMARQVVHLLESRANKKLAEVEAEKTREAGQIISAIANINSRYLNGRPGRELVSDFLNEILNITQSEYGFISELNYDAEQQPYLKSIAVTDISWDDDTQNYYRNHIDAGLEFYNMNTLFGAVIKSGQPLTTNDARNHPASGGLLTGNPALNQFAGFPLFNEDQMIGMVALANRKSGYDDKFVENIMPLIDNCSLILKAYRSEHDKSSYLIALESEKNINQSLSDKFSSLYNSLDDGVVECTVPDGKILDCNPAFCKMLGYDNKSLCAMTIFDITDQESVRISENKLNESLSDKGESDAFEKDYIHVRGHKIPSLVKVFGVKTPPNETPRAWALIKNLSVQKKRESERAQRKKMESLGTLSGGIAHDFNNILAIISGNAELIKLQQSGEACNQHATKIIDASQRGAELVQRILTFSRKGISKHTSLDFRVAVQQALNLIESTINKNIQLEVQLNSSGMVNTDESSVTQLLMNLISNASQAIEPDTGKITIRLNENSGAPHEPRYLTLSVSDTGKGMTAEQISRAFDPFFTTKEQGQGTGLGLAIVHGLVEDMQARIRIESLNGLGCKFIIDIPISHPGVKHANAPSIKDCREKHGVLVVEDECEIAQLYKEALIADGHTVFMAENGQKGLQLFERHKDKIDIIVTDDQMPILRGIDLAKQVKLQCPTIPIILLSGYISDYVNDALTRGDISLILCKPISLEELSNTIKQFKIVKTRCC